MQRLVVEEARIISLEWSEEKRYYEFRLMYGNTFITPVLAMHPMEWDNLLGTRQVSLYSERNKDESWIRLVPWFPKLQVIWIKRVKSSADPKISTLQLETRWQDVDFQAIYLLAEESRRKRPEEGSRVIVKDGRIQRV